MHRSVGRQSGAPVPLLVDGSDQGKEPVGATVVVVVDVDVVVGATVVDVDVVVVGAGPVVEVAEVVEVVEVGLGGAAGFFTVVVGAAFAFEPAGGFGCEGTGPGVATTTGVAGAVSEGGAWAGTGTPGACTRPKPARSDHQMELTRTTSPVWGALIIRPSPM